LFYLRKIGQFIGKYTYFLTTSIFAPENRKRLWTIGTFLALNPYPGERKAGMPRSRKQDFKKREIVKWVAIY